MSSRVAATASTWKSCGSASHGLGGRLQDGWSVSASGPGSCHAAAYLWCRLPDGQDSAALARRAVSENVVLAPGNVFSVSQTASAFLRFNVAQASDPHIYAVLRRAMATEDD